MKKLVQSWPVLALAVTLAGGIGYAQRNAANRSELPPGSAQQNNLVREVRHQLVLLPYYSVFDNLAFRVEGSTVTLLGQVTQPVLKSDAEKAVKGVEGVTQVNNQIQVLPLSTTDDRIRLATYRAIYSSPGFEKYSIQAVPPIHIIVDNGHVTLEGTVNSQMDKTLANTRANSVPGVFSVQNNLRVESR